MQSMPADLESRVVEYARRYAMTRNAAINYLCAYALEAINGTTQPSRNERRAQ